MTGRECVYEGLGVRNVICYTGLRAYEHRPEEGQWLHCGAGQKVTVLGQETIAVTGPLAAAAGLNAGGRVPRKVTPGAAVSE